MIVLLALAAGIAGGPYPDPVLEPIPVKPEDCLRGKVIEQAKPHPKKHLIVKHRVRLFKADPKPKDAPPPCEGALPPPLTVLTPEEPAEFSPVPEVLFAAAPEPTAGREPGTEEELGLPGSFEVAGAAAFVSWPCCFSRGVVASPVPEPAEWLLLAAGLAAIVRRART